MYLFRNGDDDDDSDDDDAGNDDTDDHHDDDDYDQAHGGLTDGEHDLGLPGHHKLRGSLR